MKYIIIIITTTLLISCGGGKKNIKKNDRNNHKLKVDIIEMEPVVIKKTENTPIYISDLFAKGNKHFIDKKYKEALKIYQIIQKLEDKKYQNLARYNIAVVYNSMKEYKKSEKIYLSLLENIENREIKIDILINLSEIYGKNKNWGKVIKTLDNFIENISFKKDHWDYIELMIRYQVALYYEKKYDLSELIYIRAYQTFKQNKKRFIYLTKKQRYFLSMCNFYIGELYRKNFKKIKIKGGVKTMGKILDKKANYILAAQNYYINSMEFKDNYWATASGYSIGEMYSDYYDQIISTKLPDKLTFEEETIYKEELKKKIQVLLKKAINIFEKNITMSERLSENNIWVKKSLKKLKETKRKYMNIKEIEWREYENE